jgi:hypothetical protein
MNRKIGLDKKTYVKLFVIGEKSNVCTNIFCFEYVVDESLGKSFLTFLRLK